MSADRVRITPERPDLGEAARRRDVTIAFTPGQLLLMALGAMLTLRLLRRLVATAGESRPDRRR